MAEQKYKSGARCRFYSQCDIYQAGLLREEVEFVLCGRGQPGQKDYIPRIQNVYGPASREAGSPSETAICPAFSGVVESLLTGKIRAYIEKVDWFWERQRTLDDIFKL